MFKYSTELTAIEGENPGSCTVNLSTQDRTSYRWVFEDNRKENYLPRALITNPRMNYYRSKCTGWSLSMFDSNDKAEKRLVQICKDKPDLFLCLGTHIAKVEITIESGMVSEPGTDGHFDLFEFVDVDFQGNHELVTNVIEKYVNE